jgi:hypothetical protein
MSPRGPKSAPLVGMHFRPPAKAILQSLPAGYPLELRPEPTNPYDANAVAVWFDASHLPDDSLEELRHTLPGQGSDIDDLCEQRFWHIGYMAREHAADHQSDIAMLTEAHNVDASVSGEGMIWTGFPARLGFDGTGKPLVLFNI